MTLEDETGQVNVILWPKQLETYRKETLGSRAARRLWRMAGGGKGAAPDREQARRQDRIARSIADDGKGVLLTLTAVNL
ncbi:hypothetical protein [Burkholderia sp. BE17]|uniref:hypothetical protein n=1 Tax=Burkholderia sp. BE17 TaxID=2656644 RepID=UPI0039EF36FF